MFSLLALLSFIALIVLLARGLGLDLFLALFIQAKIESIGEYPENGFFSVGWPTDLCLFDKFYPSKNKFQVVHSIQHPLQVAKLHDFLSFS